MIPRLILIEGMIGAGKSTLARGTTAWLRSQGESAKAYDELDDDNPIRTRWIDALRARHPHVGRLPGTGADGFAADPAAYDPSRWARLMRECVAARRTVLLDGRYMQSSAQPLYMSGAPTAQVYEAFALIRDQIAFGRPLLIYLATTSVEDLFARTCARRSAPWRSWLSRTFTDLPWSRERGVEGEEAVVAFYESWEQLAARLCAMHRGPRLVLRDAFLDWPAALQRVHGSLVGTSPGPVYLDASKIR